MIRINLLPFRAARKKENIRRQVSIFLLTFILVLLALFYINFSLGSRVNHLREKIKIAKIELKKYNEINKEIARIKKTLENLKKKMAVINKLEANRYEPVRLLDKMTAMVVPKRMWFTKLEDKGDTVRISGIALDNKTVADFMVRLQHSRLFSAVNLKTLKHQVVQNSNLKSFQVSCKKVSPKKPARKKKIKIKART